MFIIRQIEYLDINEIVPYINNPRNNEAAVDKVAASIKEFGFNVPLVIDKEKVIITGHTRYKAAKKLDLKSIPCIYAEGLTKAQVKAYRIADNKVSEYASWENELLGIELEQLQELDFDLELTGFDMDDIDNLLNFEESEKETQEDEYEVELPKEPKAKLGDIYQLGNHRLMCGDSTKLEDVKKLMGGVQADMLLTDPPYNVNYEGSTKEKLKIKNDNMSDENFRKFLVDAFKNADAVMKKGAVFYIWHADSEGYNFRGACRDNDWKIRQCLIWNKNSLVMGRQDYHWKHEPCLYGWKDGASHLWAADRKQTTILDFERPSKNDMHPTMKPIVLFDYQIKNNTKGDDIVLDLFGGSGTTIMACEQNGRKGYLMEYEPCYVDVIIDRWEQFTGEKAVLLNGELQHV